MDFCFYQARYHWNDLRGLRYDIDKKKRRIPVRCLGIFGAIAMTQIVMTAKIILGIIIAYKFCTIEEFKTIMVFVMFLFIVTSVYEFAKSNKFTKLILFTVCLGYPYRILSGIALRLVYENKLENMFYIYNIGLICLMMLAYFHMVDLPYI